MPRFTAGELSSLDFSISAIPLGTKSNHAVATENFLCLDRQDWQMLHLLLTRAVTPDVPPAATASEALFDLALFAAAAVEWYKKQQS